MAGESGPVRGGEHPGGKQRLGHPLGFAAIPPGTLAALGSALQMRLDLAGGTRTQFGHRGHDIVDEAGVFLHNLDTPATAGVFAHPPAQQRPVLDGHQRGLVCPILDQEPRRSCAVTPRRGVEHVAVIRAEPAEHRRIVGPHRHRHRVQLQHLDTTDEPAQIAAGHRTGRGRGCKALGGDRNPAGLGRGQLRGQPGHSRM